MSIEYLQTTITTHAICTLVSNMPTYIQFSLCISNVVLNVFELIYHIMQIVRGGKVSRLHDLLIIRGKTLAIVQQFETPYNKKEKIHWKTFTIGG